MDTRAERKGEPGPLFGLIGTVSRDEISREEGPRFVNLGGALYQAAVLCGLGERTRLYAHLADALAAEAGSLTSAWKTFDGHGLVSVPGPGNEVRLFYPSRGERKEVLRSAVPALEAGPILRHLAELSFLIMVVNSGFDMEVGAWRQVVEAATCPIWLDIHSLTLERVLGRPRAYRAVPEWKDWAGGAAYIQANRKEVSCMLERPEGEAQPEDVKVFCRQALDLGTKAVFVTLGKEGALVSTPDGDRLVCPTFLAEVVDTTGCGDVFCSAACSGLARGASPEEAARFGVDLASRAAQVAGVRETYELALNTGPPPRPWPRPRPRSP